MSNTHCINTKNVLLGVKEIERCFDFVFGVVR